MKMYYQLVKYLVNTRIRAVTNKRCVGSKIYTVRHKETHRITSPHQCSRDTEVLRTCKQYTDLARKPSRYRSLVAR